MKITLKYGKDNISINIPHTTNFKGIISPSKSNKVINPMAAVLDALKAPIESVPLREVAIKKKNACIVISDITRPVPNKIILPPILQELASAGLAKDDITILIATGIHRPNEGDELIELVGKEIADQYRCINHFSKNDDDMGYVGKIQGNAPAYVNKAYLNADLKILTGFIEPHMWAGFSGGRKSILPGISSIKTLQYMHGPEMVAHPDTRYGHLKGNPFHEAGLQIMELAGADFVVNVTLDNDKDITGIFAGHPVNAHLEGCSFLSQFCVQDIDTPLDFVVTTNAGAPLDCNLYQTVKGITAAAPVVKKGGDIIMASSCYEGAGSEEYIEVLNLADTPENFVKKVMDGDFFIPDQWCAQETYQVLSNHKVTLYSEGLNQCDTEKYHFKFTRNIEASIQELLKKYGKNAHWAVIPSGPMVILKLA